MADTRTEELARAVARDSGADDATLNQLLAALRRAGDERRLREEVMRWRPIDFRTLLAREPRQGEATGQRRRYEQFRPITFGADPEGNRLSIQGSETHYSTPREWAEDAQGYEAMEVGFLAQGHGLSFFPIGCPHRDEAESWGYGGFDPETDEELPFNPEDPGLGNSTVYPYMPAENIQATFAWMVVEYGLPFVYDDDGQVVAGKDPLAGE